MLYFSVSLGLPSFPELAAVSFLCLAIWTPQGTKVRLMKAPARPGRCKTETKDPRQVQRLQRHQQVHPCPPTGSTRASLTPSTAP